MSRKIPKISIIVPFFGKFDRRSLEIVIRSVALQGCEDIEFLVSTGSNVLNYNLDSSSSEIEIFLNKLELAKKSTPLAGVPRGQIYNQGISVAKGDYLYLSDSDIVFPANFFKQALEEADRTKTPLYRPKMRRLLLRDFERFYSLILKEGIKEALRKLDFSEEFLVRMDKFAQGLKVFRKFENGRMKIFTITPEEYEKYVSNPDNRGSEPKFFNQDRHCGSTLATKDQFQAIGGCCQGFVSWGCWDADLQWKLRERYGLSYMPGEVIHLDHTKDYFDRDKWKTDRAFQEFRRRRGVAQCILEDSTLQSI